MLLPHGFTYSKSALLSPDVVRMSICTIGGGEFGPSWHQAALKQHR